MKKDIILAGVGGQGILSIAAIIGYAAVENGLYLKQAEVHGMSQRGGDVQSHLRISSKPIYSDLIALGSADMILSVEPLEALRYVPYLCEGGWLITSSNAFKNIPNYPDVDAVHQEVKKQKHFKLIDAEAIAKELGNARASNIVMLGAAADYLEIPIEKLEDGIRYIFGRKGDEVVDLNIKALRAGKDAVSQ